MNQFGRQSLSERLTNLGESKSYVFLGQRASNQNNNSASIRDRFRRTTSVFNAANTINTANANLARDDFLIFELIFHAQDTSDNENGEASEKRNTSARKKSISDPSDYSVVYHHWTLRELYRHVVSSIKTDLAATSTTTAPATPRASIIASGDGRRLRSSSFSGPVFDASKDTGPVDITSPTPPFPPKQPPRTRRSSTIGATPASNRHPTRRESIMMERPNRHHHSLPKLLGSNLHPRDMRRLVTPFSASNEPELIVRRHVMVFNFDPLRAIITRDRFLVLVPNGADSVLKNLEERIVGSALEYAGYNESTENSAEDNGNDDHEQALRGAEGTIFENEEEYSDDSVQDGWSDMMIEMEMEGQRNDLTFELLCVNACLSTVFEMLADDTRELQDRGLQCVQERVIGDRSYRKKSQPRPLRPEDALAVIRNLKNAVKVMQARVKGFVHSLNRILDEDEDMALMNLSRLVTHPENFVQPISQELLEIESDEPELVLESNLHNALTLSNALDLIQGQVDTARYASILFDLSPGNSIFTVFPHFFCCCFFLLQLLFVLVI